MSSTTTAGRAQDQRKKRSAPSDNNDGDAGKKRKPNGPSTSSDKNSKDQPSPAVRQVVPKEGPVIFHPSTSSSIIPAKITHPPPSKNLYPVDPRPASSLSSSSARNRLTKQLYEQIPFLENDPLKALEMLKKMVQESGLETLYGSVNENTHRSRDFTERVTELKKNVENILKFMISGKASEQEKLEKYKEMKNIWSKIHGLNEAKVKLTQNAYDMVDRVIRRLDKELETIVDEIGDTKTETIETGPGVTGGKLDGPMRRRDRDFDMPVDPNEPTYCECKQISFGEMIACDNVNCPIEWFHFTCVGLTSKPKGKWFCKRCVAAGQNKQGKKKKARMGIIEKYASASDKSEVEHLLSGSDESD